MTEARRKRLKEAKDWFPAQGFTEDSHVVKAYRERFDVDRECAMRELCLLGMLSPEKQRSYEEQLEAKARKRAENQAARKACRAGRKEDPDSNPDQDENFFFIAGYTSGGAPYGITWEQAEEDRLK